MADPDVVRSSYDDLAETYAEHRSTDEPATAVLQEFLAETPAPVERVLDAGCGHGEPVLTRIEETATGVGLDASREMLRLAARTDARRLAQGDMTRLPFATESFDAVVAFWSLIHVPLADHPTVIEEFARVLEPGGRVLVCEGSQPWVGENPDWLDSGVGMQWAIAGAERTREQLHDAGLTVTEAWGVPETLGEDEDGSDLGDDDPAWTFLAAELAD